MSGLLCDALRTKNQTYKYSNVQSTDVYIKHTNRSLLPDDLIFVLLKPVERSRETDHE